MKSRAPNKRQICRYFASGNSCYYGDACQFQHVLDVDGSSLVAPLYRQASNTGSVSSSKGGVSPPLCSQTAGSKPIHPGPITQPISEIHKREHAGFHGVSSSAHRQTGCRSSLSHHASNPPKHRMSKPAFKTGGVASHGHLAQQPGSLQSGPQKREKDGVRGGGGGAKRGEERCGGMGGGRSGEGMGESRDGMSGRRVGDGMGRGGEVMSGRRGGDGIPERGDKGGGERSNIWYPGVSMGFPALHPPPSSKQTNRVTTPSSSASHSPVQSGGTTYFYSSQQLSYAPDYTVYSGPPAHLAPGKNASSACAGFFASEELRQELQQQQLSCLTLTPPDSSCPKEVDHYHSLCPLEPVGAAAPDQKAKRSFGHMSTCYRAVNQKDGCYYCLRRIHGFRLTSSKALQELDKWKQLEHVNLVSLKEMFTTKAFGDHSVVFVYNFHSAAETLKEKYSRHSKRASPLPEDLVWQYLVQLASALRLVHAHHLAVRSLEPSKVLVSSRQRLRLNFCGIVDMLTYDGSSSSSSRPLSPTTHQQGDLYALGQLMVSVGLQSPEAGRPDQLRTSMEVVSSTYSPDLTHLFQYLLRSGSKSPPHSIMEVLAMMGAQIHCFLERSLLHEDVLEMELSKELQNGRLFRLLSKLGTINERPEFAGDEQWAETGDRYLLKLLRDHMFHQVHPSGTPWINLAHIVQTLNKVDAGTYENVALHSRDEQSVLVVSYADLKLCLEKTFSELLSASLGKPANHGTTVGDNRWSLNGHNPP